jgi:NADPH:quinone reductase-like Zn-dependent oxidoreductase
MYHPFYLIEHNIRISGVQVLLLWNEVEYFRRVMGELMSLHQAGVIKPHIDAVFPLDQVAAAHRFVEQRRSKGKVLLTTERI